MILRQANQVTLLSSLPSLIVVAVLAPAIWWLLDKSSADIHPSIQVLSLVAFLATIPIGLTAGVLGILFSFQGRFSVGVRFLLLAVNLGAILVALGLVIEIVEFMNFWGGFRN